MKEISNSDYTIIMRGLRFLDYREGMTLKEQNAVRRAKQVYKKLNKRYGDKRKGTLSI